MDRLTLARPDDWHLHLRDGPEMASVLADTARVFARAIVMPNLQPPVRTTEEALRYRERILAALPPDVRFEPLMTLYLTDDTPAEEIARARLSTHVHGVKLYPAGATTHSDAGVTRISRCFAALEKMEQLGLPLLIHGDADGLYPSSVNAYPQLAPPKRFVTIQGGTHAFPFEDTPEASDELVRTITTAFWDRYLKGERAGVRTIRDAVTASGLATLQEER